MPTDHENDARIAREKAEAEAKADDEARRAAAAAEQVKHDEYYGEATHPILGNPFLSEYGH